jgi:hypothetical protein
MRLLKEDDVAFHLAHDDGRTTTVPKRGLHRTVQDHIRTIPKAENFCHGGMVKGYAEGGDVQPDPSLVLTGDPATDALIQGAPPVEYPPRDLNAITIQGAGTTPVALNRTTGIPVDAPGEKHGLEQAPPVPVPPSGVAAHPSAPGPQGFQPPQFGGFTDPAAAERAYLASNVIPKQSAAADRQAQVEAEIADTKAKAKQVEIDATQAGADARQRYWDGRMAEYRKMRDDVMNDRIDPRRLWNSKSTGDKALSMIGIVLGGMGAGLTGGPNPALGVVQKLIEQDIDAQRVNLGKKQSLLAMHLDETKDMSQAMRETTIDKLSAYRAAVEKAELQFGGERAKANAAAFKASLDAAIAPLVAKSAEWKNNMAMFQYQMGAMQQMLGGPGDAKYVPGAPRTAPTELSLKGAAEARNSDTARRVSLPGGAYTHATTPGAAEKVEAVKSGVEGGLKTLEDLKALGRDPSPGSIQRRGTLIQALAEDIARSQGQSGSTEAVKFWEGRIPGMLGAQGSGYDAIERVLLNNGARMLTTHVSPQAAAYYVKWAGSRKAAPVQ